MWGFIFACALLLLFFFLPIRAGVSFDVRQNVRFAFCLEIFGVLIYMRHGVFVRNAPGNYGVKLFDCDDVFMSYTQLLPITRKERRAERLIMRIAKKDVISTLLSAFRLSAAEIEGDLALNDASFLAVLYGAVCAAFGALGARLSALGAVGQTRARVRFGEKGSVIGGAFCVKTDLAGLLKAAALLLWRAHKKARFEKTQTIHASRE